MIVFIFLFIKKKKIKKTGHFLCTGKKIKAILNLFYNLLLFWWKPQICSCFYSNTRRYWEHSESIRFLCTSLHVWYHKLAVCWPSIHICMFLQRLYFRPNALEFLYPQKKLNCACLSLGNTAIWAEVCGWIHWGMHVKVSVQERKIMYDRPQGNVWKWCVCVCLYHLTSLKSMSFKLKTSEQKRPEQEAENIHEPVYVCG